MTGPVRGLLVGGAAVIAALILLVLARLGADEEEDPGPVAEELSVEDAARVPCPAQIPGAEELNGPGELPIGPLAVRLCSGPAPEASVPLPANSVATEDLDTLVEVVNTAAAVPQQEMCTKELGPAYSLQFTYADGSSVLMIGETYGCRHIQIGGTARTGVGTDLLTAVQERLG